MSFKVGLDGVNATRFFWFQDDCIIAALFLQICPATVLRTTNDNLPAQSSCYRGAKPTFLPGCQGAKRTDTHRATIAKAASSREQNSPNCITQYFMKLTASEQLQPQPRPFPFRFTRTINAQ